MSLVSINATSVLAGELLEIVFIGLRLTLSVYFPFYLHRYQKVHQVTLIAALITAFSVLFPNLENSPIFSSSSLQHY